MANKGYDVHFIVPNATTKKVNKVNIHGVEHKSQNRFIRMVLLTKKIYKKAIDTDADVYHFHDPELLPIGIKLKKQGKKVIYDIHEDLPRAIISKQWIPFVFRTTISKIVEIYENTTARKFDLLLTATPHITKRFLNINENTININNYPLLRELENLSPKETKWLQNIVSYVGGLSPIRGGHELLEAAESINGTLKIAGSIKPENLKIDLINQKKIKYIGVLNREHVQKLLEESSVGIVTFLPEPNHINAQPNKMFEYMSASIPVICSDFPLWRSIIDRHNCGICVDPEDPIAISKAINYLFENPEVAAEMGKNGRKAIENEYNWETESKKLINAYKQFVK